MRFNVGVILWELRIRRRPRRGRSARTSTHQSKRTRCTALTLRSRHPSRSRTSSRASSSAPGRSRHVRRAARRPGALVAPRGRASSRRATRADRLPSGRGRRAHRAQGGCQGHRVSGNPRGRSGSAPGERPHRHGVQGRVRPVRPFLEPASRLLSPLRCERRRRGMAGDRRRLGRSVARPAGRVRRAAPEPPRYTRPGQKRRMTRVGPASGGKRMAFATLKYELTDGIAVVTINRPEKNNAISMEMRADFRALADELYANETVRVVVFTGTGKTFCVGADVSTFETDWNTPAFRANTRLLTSFFNDLEALEKPLIAAINGTCVGGGLELALACDLRIAARSARFGLPENNLGLIPGIGGCSRLVKLVGFGRAKELVLTGEIVSADEALRCGLVNRVVEDAELASEARALAARLAAKAPQALGLAKRVIQSCVSADLHTARTLESFGQFFF